MSWRKIPCESVLLLPFYSIDSLISDSSGTPVSGERRALTPSQCLSLFLTYPETSHLNTEISSTHRDAHQELLACFVLAGRGQKKTWQGLGTLMLEGPTGPPQPRIPHTLQHPDKFPMSIGTRLDCADQSTGVLPRCLARCRLQKNRF